MSEPDLKNKVKELEDKINSLEKDLIQDSLTGLKTRAFFEEETQTYLDAIAGVDAGKRREWFGFKNLSVLFFDVDHFKKINDNFGHDMGDKVLKKVSETIMTSLRGGDTAARWGGEEIVASLLGAHEKDAKIKAEEIRQSIEKIKFTDSPDLKITVSIGVATVQSGMNCHDIVRCADKAMYIAKKKGRNKVISYSEIQK